MKRLASAIALATLALVGCAARPTPISAEAPKSALVAAAAAPQTPPPNVDELVHFEAKTSNSLLRERDGGSVLVRLHLTAKALRHATRPAMNLGLVVDTSGSMEGKAIEDARNACLSLLDSLSVGDRLTVVAFDSEPHILLPSTTLSKENLKTVRDQIATMKAAGTTDLSGGLSTGLSEMMKGFQSAGVNRMVLVSDGVPNEESPILPLARQARQQGISITSLGLGLDYNETLVSMIATESGGKYHYLRDSSMVATVFQDEVLKLSQTIGRGATIQLSPGPGVVIEDVIGLSWQKVGNKAQVVLGDFSEGEERDVVVRLSAPARRKGSVVELLDAGLGFEDAISGGRRLSTRAFVAARSSDDPDAIDAAKDRDVERVAARVALADKIIRAVGAARGGDLQRALSILDAAEKEARLAQKELTDKELDEKLKSLPALRQSLPALVQQAHLVATDVVHPVPNGMPGLRAPSLPKAPVAVPAAAPAIVMETQADAMRTIQGM